MSFQHRVLYQQRRSILASLLLIAACATAQKAPPTCEVIGPDVSHLKGRIAPEQSVLLSLAGYPISFRGCPASEIAEVFHLPTQAGQALSAEAQLSNIIRSSHTHFVRLKMSSPSQAAALVKAILENTMQRQKQYHTTVPRDWPLFPGGSAYDGHPPTPIWWKNPSTPVFWKQAPQDIPDCKTVRRARGVAAWQSGTTVFYYAWSREYYRPGHCPI